MLNKDSHVELCGVTDLLSGAHTQMINSRWWREICQPQAHVTMVDFCWYCDGQATYFSDFV